MIVYEHYDPRGVHPPHLHDTAVEVVDCERRNRARSTSGSTASVSPPRTEIGGRYDRRYYESADADLEEYRRVINGREYRFGRLTRRDGRVTYTATRHGPGYGRGGATVHILVVT